MTPQKQCLAPVRRKQRDWDYKEPTNIIYRHYKDPVEKLPKKYFGYHGMILEDADTGRIQCNICGKWFFSLAGHLKVHKDEIEGRAIHPTKQNSLANSYKDMFGLFHSSALCSEEIRSSIIETRKKEPYWEKKRKRKWALNRNKPGSHRGVNNLACDEGKNKRERCYLQLLNFIKMKAISLGRVPNHNEAIDDHGLNLYPSIVRMFESYKNAIKLLKMEYKSQRNKSLGKAFLLECLKDFEKDNGREVSFSDFGNERIPSLLLYKKEFGGYKEALKLIKQNYGK